jgi:hypothetical protein
MEPCPESCSECLDADNSSDDTDEAIAHDQGPSEDLVETVESTQGSFGGDEESFELQDEVSGISVKRGNDITDSQSMTNIDHHTCIEKQDFGFLQQPVSDALRVEIVKLGPESFQNKNARFCEIEGRSFSASWFNRKTTNGEENERKWLLYSPHKVACYCFPCFLFQGEGNNVSSFCQEKAFSKWKKLNPRVPDYESSSAHRESLRKYLTMATHLKQDASIDASAKKLMEQESRHWEAVI